MRNRRQLLVACSQLSVWLQESVVYVDCGNSFFFLFVLVLFVLRSDGVLPLFAAE